MFKCVILSCRLPLFTILKLPSLSLSGSIYKLIINHNNAHIVFSCTIMHIKYFSSYGRLKNYHQQLLNNCRYKRSWHCTVIHNMHIKAALIDLSGTLHVEDQPTPNAPNALKRLRESGVMIKFVTNTTKESRQTLLNRLLAIGFEIDKNEIHSSLSAAVEYVKKEKLNPFYLVSKDARTDFPFNDDSKPFDSVAVGLAPDEFYYENLNKAFNILLANKNHKLIAIHEGKYYKRKDGLALGPGCFVKGLEYTTGTSSILIGKPNEYFFKSALTDDIRIDECVMIGDDPKDDIVGAMRVGLKGIQVKTGKYLPDVVVDPPPTVLVENFSEAVDWILKNRG